MVQPIWHNVYQQPHSSDTGLRCFGADITRSICVSLLRVNEFIYWEKKKDKRSEMKRSTSLKVVKGNFIFKTCFASHRTIARMVPGHRCPVFGIPFVIVWKVRDANH